MPLTAGTRLGPYEIQSALGAGGMGEVYRARDLRLGRTVALKVLPDSFRSDAEFRDRFEREARAIGGLNHPHICTLHDVGQHDGIEYLVMEYLDGETLAERLRRSPLELEEFLRVAIQVTLALEAAHEQHVIHRDVKPGNIFLTGRGQAKVVDFGLAKQAPTAGDSIAVTRAATSIFAGTIEYMSPEQARGQDLDPRSDLFSLGIVLYEMATGRNPFRGADLVDTLHRVVHHTPDRIAGTGRGAWTQIDRIVVKCLEKRPEHRYSSASQLLADLLQVEGARRPGVDSVRLPALPPATGVARIARRRLVLVLGAAALVLAAATAMWLARRSPVAHPVSTSATRDGPRVRQSIAVLGIQNLAGRNEDAWLSTALAEMLSAELGRTGALRLAAGQNIDRAKRELGLREGTTLDPDTLRKVRAIVGVDLVVIGSYLADTSEAPRLTLALSIQDAVAGETIATFTETGRRDAILPLVTVVGGQMRQQLGAAGSPAASDAVHAGLSSDGRALRLYVEGLNKLRAQDFMGARDTLHEAAAADPRNALIRLGLADAWASLGYDHHAKEEAAHAAEYAHGLSREDTLRVESRSYEMAKQWNKAIESYRTLHGFFPDNVDHGLALAGVLTKAGRPADALATIDALRRLPEPAGTDARLDLAEAEAAHETGDYERELSAGRAAADHGVALGARLLVAQGRLAQAQAHLRLGRRTEAARLLESARQLFLAGGDRSGEARTLNRIANIAYEDGDYERAEQLFRETERATRSIGNLSYLTIALNNVADTLMIQDELAGAAPLFTEALEIAQQLGDVVSEGFVQLNLAELALRRGSLREAGALGTSGLKLCRDGNHTYGVYMGLLVLGEVALAEGRMEDADRLLGEGLRLARTAGDQRFTANLLAALGHLAAAQSRHDTARERHTEALEIRTRAGAHTEIAESQLAVAQLSPAEGSIAAVGSAIDTYKSRGLRAGEAYARATQAALLLEAKRPGDARAAADTAERLLPQVHTVSRQLWIAIQIARVRAAEGLTGPARASLRSTLAESRRHGFVVLQTTASQALAELSTRQSAGTARSDR